MYEANFVNMNSHQSAVVSQPTRRRGHLRRSYAVLNTSLGLAVFVMVLVPWLVSKLNYSGATVLPDGNLILTQIRVIEFRWSSAVLMAIPIIIALANMILFLIRRFR